MTEVTFKKGQTVVEKNSPGQAFYIITEGKVHVSNIGSGKSTFSEHDLKAGDYFGERSLISGEKRAADITVVSNECRVLVSVRVQRQIQNVFTLVFAAFSFVLTQAIECTLSLRLLTRTPSTPTSEVSQSSSTAAN